jgi:glycosyltransferase involved in cell wall biosynthesis
LKKPIKILYLIDLFNPGGTEKQLILLTENLPKDKFDISICTLETNEYQNSLSLDNNIFSLKSSTFPILKNLQKLYKLITYIKKNEFAIIQTQFTTSEIYGILSAFFLKRKPILIGTRRNIYHWINEERISFLILKFLSKNNSYCISNSNSAAIKCQEIENISLNKIRIIENGIDTIPFDRITTAEAKKKYSFENHFPVIGTVGNWRPVKGMVFFVKAAGLVIQNYPNALFILAGHGPQKIKLMNLAKDLNIEQNIRFFEKHDDIPGLIKTFDIAVQPSLAESFSNVLLEYMCAAKAIVATRVGEAERMLENGKLGMLVKPGNEEELAEGIMKVASDQKHAQTIGKEAREKVQKNWSLPVFLENYTKFYCNLVKDI